MIVIFSHKQKLVQTESKAKEKVYFFFRFTEVQPNLAKQS